jgi:hypothetical protein
MESNLLRIETGRLSAFQPIPDMPVFVKATATKSVSGPVDGPLAKLYRPTCPLLTR